MNILIVEDDVPLASVLQQALERERHTVRLATDGDRALTSLNTEQYGLVLLDLTLPKLSGFDLLRHLRNQQNDVPVLVVSGRCGIEERVHALDGGADDFLAKPFSLMELTARVRALMRRTRPAPETTMRVADLVIDRLQGCAERAGRKIELTSREFSLLELLAFHHGQAVSRSTILKGVWGSDGEIATNIVDVYINYLRKKIDSSAIRKLVHTVRGVGYCLGEQNAASQVLYRGEQLPAYLAAQLNANSAPGAHTA